MGEITVLVPLTPISIFPFLKQNNVLYTPINGSLIGQGKVLTK
jgi:hypothetical protein